MVDFEWICEHSDMGRQGLQILRENMCIGGEGQTERFFDSDGGRQDTGGSEACSGVEGAIPGGHHSHD